MDPPIANRDIVIFDGFCNFCSGSVLFIIKRDRNFLFAASQSPAGQALLQRYGNPELAASSIILISNQEIFMKSDAALRIARRLNGLWPLLQILRVFPSAFLDYFYDLFASRRYRFYGRRDECFLPGREIRDRFL